jgi:hypothetical protein
VNFGKYRFYKPSGNTYSGTECVALFNSGSYALIIHDSVVNNLCGVLSDQII